MKKIRWEELEALDAKIILHPIGGDCHVIINNNDLDVQKNAIERLKALLSTLSVNMALVRSHEDLSTVDLGQFAVPNGYTLMKRLKEQLDPSDLFISPFYNL
ncbi:MAG: hypothetical protein GY786_06060 [Proteobacteria bacterium]|nr:hypothetical protein [Pseudomonadota bacterium]